MKYAWTSASTKSEPSSHHSAAGLADCWRSFWGPPGRLGLGNRNLFLGKAQLVAVHADDDVIAVHEATFEHPPREGIEQVFLQRPLERAGAIRRIIAFADEKVFRRVGEVHRDLPIGQPLQQTPELDVHNLLDVLARQRVEEEDLVDPVQEFGPEMIAQRLQI